MTDQINMNQYLVFYRDADKRSERMRHVVAHRVEGWKEDYAFFGHSHFPGIATLLIPRELVDEVQLLTDQFGNPPYVPENDYADSPEAIMLDTLIQLSQDEDNTLAHATMSKLIDIGYIGVPQSR